MSAMELTRDDNPRWLAALTTALPVALAVLFVMWLYQPDTRRSPVAVPLPTPAPVTAPPAEPHPGTSLARVP